MTTAFLRRNRAFERLGARVVDVLTFDARPHYPELERSLRERGLLTASARLINMWDWLREHPLTDHELLPTPLGFEPLDATVNNSASMRDGVVLARTRMRADGEILQIDHYRDDGSLLASDRRDVAARGTLGGRSIVLCDAAGRPMRGWRRAADFYRHWLDLLRAAETGPREPAVMIVDSKTAARFMLDYRRPDVTVVHVLHGSHLADRGGGDQIRESRRAAFARLRDFDLVVTLTETQRRDIQRRLPRARNLVAIPNSVEDAPAALPAAEDERDRGQLAVVASLIPRKRVSSAIWAVAAVRTGGMNAQLTVYGDGPQRAKLEGLIGRLDAGDYVRLAGHVPGADQRLATASMLLLTSHSEGFGLVLLEAMARGCIPIAYDIPYGPADIIADGVSGFLVPEGDIEALAATIRHVLELDQAELERLRAAGRATVSRYSDEAVLPLWAAALGRRAAPARRSARRVRLAPPQWLGGEWIDFALRRTKRP